MQVVLLHFPLHVRLLLLHSLLPFTQEVVKMDSSAGTVLWRLSRKTKRLYRNKFKLMLWKLEKQLCGVVKGFAWLLFEIFNFWHELCTQAYIVFEVPFCAYSNVMVPKFRQF